MTETINALPDFIRRISTAVEYCTECEAVLSSDGCSNPDCWKTRQLYPLQEAMRTLALNKIYGTNNHKGSQQSLHRIRRERPYTRGWFSSRCGELFSRRVQEKVLGNGQSSVS